jgi:hypothetical protein
VSAADAEDSSKDSWPWPDAERSFWLGSSNNTRSQARQLARLQAAFGLGATEKLLASWGCALAASAENGRVRGRLYLTSSALVFLSSRDTKGRLVRLEHLVALDKTRVSGLLSGRAAAITAQPAAEAGEAPLQLCAFRSRNRTYSSLQRELITRVPLLAATWRLPSSSKLQSHLHLPADTLCLGEVSVASESARGVLLLTPTLLAYVADGASADADTLAAGCWLLELADVLRVRVEATGGGAGRKPRGKPTPQLRLRTRVFEASLEVISPVAEAVELLEGVLPEGVLECDEFVAAPAAASVRAFEGDGADDPTDATDGADVETVHELASERCDGRAAFRAALSVQSRPVTLHEIGRAHV